MNTQAPEARLNRTDGAVEIVAVFETIQGEGPFAGSPAVFVRLAGCNLRCPACDSLYTLGRNFITPLELVEWVRARRPSGLVVITGGEPFRQQLGPGVLALVQAGFGVQIETNGSLYWEDFPFDLATIVCSPKGAIDRRLEPHINAWKYVISADAVDPTDGLPTSALGMPTPPARPQSNPPGVRVYVQPADAQDPETNMANLKAAMHSCFQFGYYLSIQTHKLLGLP